MHCSVKHVCDSTRCTLMFCHNCLVMECDYSTNHVWSIHCEQTITDLMQLLPIHDPISKNICFIFLQACKHLLKYELTTFFFILRPICPTRGSSHTASSKRSKVRSHSVVYKRSEWKMKIYVMMEGGWNSQDAMVSHPFVLASVGRKHSNTYAQMRPVCFLHQQQCPFLNSEFTFSKLFTQSAQQKVMLTKLWTTFHCFDTKYI